MAEVDDELPTAPNATEADLLAIGREVFGIRYNSDGFATFVPSIEGRRLQLVKSDRALRKAHD